MFVCVLLSKMGLCGLCVMYCVRLYVVFVVCDVCVCICVGAFLVLMCLYVLFAMCGVMLHGLHVFVFICVLGCVCVCVPFFD